MKRDVPVLVLGLSYGGLGVTRSLGRLGVPAYGLDGTPRAPASRSRYCRSFFAFDIVSAPPEQTVERLLAIGRRLGRPLLVPTEDHTALFVADHADALSELFLVPEQPSGLARTLSDKRLLYELCCERAVPTPATSFPQSREDVLAFLEGTLFPVVVKGIDRFRLARRTGVNTAVVVHDADELLSIYDRLEEPDRPNLLLQEYIPGGHDASWMFNGYFGANSECLLGLTARKLRQFPASGGVTTLGTCVPNRDVEDATRALMGALGYRGILDCGWRFDARDGRYKLFDVNPRVGATFRLFVDSAGMDVVRALYLDLTGQPVTTGQPRPGRKWMLESHDPVSSWRYWRDGSLPAHSWLRSLRGVDELAWWARDDPRPFLRMCLNMLARAAKLLIGTVRSQRSLAGRAVEVHEPASAVV